MNEYKIEKGIPVPEPKAKKYPYASMLVGDSFFLSANGRPAEAIDKLLRSSSYQAQKRFGFKFVVRVVEGGVRVWRTE